MKPCESMKTFSGPSRNEHGQPCPRMAIIPAFLVWRILRTLSPHWSAIFADPFANPFPSLAIGACCGSGRASWNGFGVAHLQAPPTRPRGR